MRSIHLSILIITCLASCHKKETTNCETDITQIAGSYQLTKLEKVYYSTGAVQDVTNTLTSCQLSGIYHLNANSTAVYTEEATCTGSGTGTWRLEGTTPYIYFNTGFGGWINSAPFQQWDCNQMIFMTYYPTIEYNCRFTLSRL